VSEFDEIHQVHTATGDGFDDRHRRPDLSDVPF
jgi:hypothetical protein